MFFVKKSKFFFLSFAFFLALFSCMVFCKTNVAFAEDAVLSVSEDAAKGLTDLQDVFYTIIESGGDILFALGIWKYGVSMSSDNASEVSKGISFLIVGAALANIRTIMGA